MVNSTVLKETDKNSHPPEDCHVYIKSGRISIRSLNSLESFWNIRDPNFRRETPDKKVTATHPHPTLISSSQISSLG